MANEYEPIETKLKNGKKGATPVIDKTKDSDYIAIEIKGKNGKLLATPVIDKTSETLVYDDIVVYDGKTGKKIATPIIKVNPTTTLGGDTITNVDWDIATNTLTITTDQTVFNTLLSGIQKDFILNSDGSIKLTNSDGSVIDLPVTSGNVYTLKGDSNSITLVENGVDLEPVNIKTDLSNYRTSTNQDIIDNELDNRLSLEESKTSTVVQNGTTYEFYDKNGNLVTSWDNTTLFNYVGNYPTVGDLPTTGTIGDVALVDDTSDLYYWNGSTWSKIDLTIDLSNYYTKDQNDALLDNKANLTTEQSLAGTITLNNPTDNFVTYLKSKIDALNLAQDTAISNNTSVISNVDSRLVTEEGKTSLVEVSADGKTYTFLDKNGTVITSWTIDDPKLFNFVGEFDTFTNLPSTGNLGDIAKVTDENKYYFYDGASWNVLDFTVDLTQYRPSADQDVIDNAQNVKIDTNTNNIQKVAADVILLDGAILLQKNRIDSLILDTTDLTSRVFSNESNIITLNASQEAQDLRLDSLESAGGIPSLGGVKVNGIITGLLSSTPTKLGLDESDNNYFTSTTNGTFSDIIFKEVGIYEIKVLVEGASSNINSILSAVYWQDDIMINNSDFTPNLGTFSVVFNFIVNVEDTAKIYNIGGYDDGAGVITLNKITTLTQKLTDQPQYVKLVDATADQLRQDNLIIELNNQINLLNSQVEKVVFEGFYLDRIKSDGGLIYFDTLDILKQDDTVVVNGSVLNIEEVGVYKLSASGDLSPTATMTGDAIIYADHMSNQTSVLMPNIDSAKGNNSSNFTLDFNFEITQSEVETGFTDVVLRATQDENYNPFYFKNVHVKIVKIK